MVGGGHLAGPDPYEALSPIAMSGTTVGRIQHEAAAREVLSDLEGCPVACRRLEVACGALGTAACAEGTAFSDAAGTEALAAPVERLSNESALVNGHFEVVPHVDGRHLLVVGAGRSSSALPWFQRLTSLSDADIASL